MTEAFNAVAKCLKCILQLFTSLLHGKRRVHPKIDKNVA